MFEVLSDQSIYYQRFAAPERSIKHKIMSFIGFFSYNNFVFLAIYNKV